VCCYKCQHAKPHTRAHTRQCSPPDMLRQGQHNGTSTAHRNKLNSYMNSVPELYCTVRIARASHANSREELRGSSRCALALKVPAGNIVTLPTHHNIKHCYCCQGPTWARNNAVARGYTAIASLLSHH
jgi:hypothetical protein